MSKYELKEEIKKPVLEFYSAQLRTIYSELHSILISIEFQQRSIIADESIYSVSKIKHFSNDRFKKLHDICDKINNYLIELEDYNNLVMSEMQEE